MDAKVAKTVVIRKYYRRYAVISRGLREMEFIIHSS